jgi:hypothetical protein
MAAALLRSADTAFPAFATALATALPAAITARTAAGGSALETVGQVLLVDQETQRASYTPCTCYVVPRPQATLRREWQTPQRDDGLACDVVVVLQGQTSADAAASALAYQRVIDVACTRIGQAGTVEGVWRIVVERPINRQVGIDRYRRAAGHEVRLWMRVTREET